MWNKFENIFGKGSSLQRKIIILYLFTAILPIILIVSFIGMIYYQSMLKRTNQWVNESCRQQAIVVGERMDAFEEVLYELVSNKQCIDLAKKLETDDESELHIDQAHLETMLENSVYTHDGIRGITFLANNGRYASYTKWYGSLNETIWSQEEVQNEIRKEIGNQRKLTFIETVNLSRSNARQDYVILMGFPVQNLRTLDQSGVLVMALDCNVLTLDDDQSELKNNGVTKIIVDDSDKIVAGASDSYINDSLENYIKNNYEESDHLSERKYKIEGTKWTIENIINTKLYQHDIIYWIRIVIIVTIVITLVFFLILYIITQKYLRNVSQIAQGIHNYKGMDAEKNDLEINHKDELYTIVRQFNKMKARVKMLVDTLQKKNEEIKIAADNQKHAEIKALEAQINPHFLYNTLDSINWRAIEHDEEEISEMLSTLGSLLRYSVSNIDMVVLLRAEISWLRKYVFLQRDRFQNSFDCAYDISEEAMDYPIYKMLLQPIIENAILHAFEEIKQGGLICVKAYVNDEEKLVIDIRDNGCGMTREQLQKITDEVTCADGLNRDSIGISNIVHRLRIYYKDQAKITVESVLGQGTKFRLVIPTPIEKRKYTGERDEDSCNSGR